MSLIGDDIPSAAAAQTRATTVVAGADAEPARGAAASRPSGSIRRAILSATPELMSLALLVIAFTVAASVLPRFLDARYLLDRSTVYMEAGIMALAMTFVIAAGHIDLSCAAILALTGALVMKLHASLGVPMLPLMVLAPIIGAALGAVNGLVVSRLNIPSLVVTLATMAAYRGFAQALIGDNSVPMPATYAGFDDVLLAGTSLPMPVALFIVVAIVLGLVLHKTLFGAYVLALGTNAEASRYSGIPVGRTTAGVFVLSGLAAGVGAMMMCSRFAFARWDHALGLELDVITAVVLGGASIFGGRATIFGTVIALLLIGVLQSAMGLANVDGEYQATANGALLIFAVIASNLAARLQGRQTR
jgi:rhamnose transport system permease protein